MRKQYTADEILEMTVGKRKADLSADYDGDNAITDADARYAARASEGLEKTVYRPDENNSVMSQTVLENIMKNAADTEDINTEALYSRYKKMYEDDAGLAAENTYGLLSAQTGGYGNSYAASAAASAYKQYMNGLYEQLPELEQNAYERTQDKEDSLYKLYELLRDDEKEDYERYVDETERQSQSEKDDLNFAVKAAQNGDYSYFENLGIDTSYLKYTELMKTAAQLAEYGDYSGLEALGVDLSALKKQNRLDLALSLAKYGDFSVLGEYTDYPYSLISD